MRPKWDEKRGDATYGERTIAEALARQTEHYSPHGGAQLLVQQAAQQARPGHGPPDQDDSLPYSDFTNALGFVRDHGENLRYCYPWNAWLVWTGTHWQRDTSGAVMRLAKQTVKRLARHMEDLDDARATRCWRMSKPVSVPRNSKRWSRMRSQKPGIAVQPDELDTIPGCSMLRMARLTLRTGKLRPHARRICSPLPCPSRMTPRLLPDLARVLGRIMAGNQNLLAFLQRAIGYALTGVIREHVLLILWGSGPQR